VCCLRGGEVLLKSRVFVVGRKVFFEVAVSRKTVGCCLVFLRFFSVAN
jgi:hypothetical protein